MNQSHIINGQMQCPCEICSLVIKHDMAVHQWRCISDQLYTTTARYDRAVKTNNHPFIYNLKLRLQTLQQVHCFFYTYIVLLEEKIEGIHNDNVDLMMMMMMFSLLTAPDLTSGNEDESTSDEDSSEDGEFSSNDD